MIKLLSQPDMADFILAAKLYLPGGINIVTAQQIYEKNAGNSAFNETMFWLGRDGQNNLCAVAKLYDRLYISCHSYDMSELLAFIGMVGNVSEIHAPPAICLHFKNSFNIALGVCISLTQQIYACADITTSTIPVDKALALMAKVENLPVPDLKWSPWYMHLTRAVRENLAVMHGIYAAEKLVACGGIYALGSEFALIAGLVTDVDFRGRGYATGLIKSLCAICSADGRFPFVMCLEHLQGFYENLGFKPCGEWAVATIK